MRPLAFASVAAALVLAGLALAPVLAPDAAAPVSQPEAAESSPVSGGFDWPIAPPRAVLHEFDAAAVGYAAGHRGVDLAADQGQTVLAPAAGVVSFAGQVAGRGVIVIDHGDLKTTLEPVTASVQRGDLVAKGQPVGELAGQHAWCAPESCLHWGARAGPKEYVDPLSLLERVRAVLLE